MDIEKLRKLTEKGKRVQAAREEEIKAARAEHDKKMEAEGKKILEKRLKEIIDVIPLVCGGAAERGESSCIVHSIGYNYDKSKPPKDNLSNRIFKWCENEGLNPTIKNRRKAGRSTGVDEWIDDEYAWWIEVSW